MLALRRRTSTALALAAGATLVLGFCTPASAGILNVQRGAIDPAPPLSAAATIERISGTDRYATSVAASRAAFPGSDGPDVVYLVTGENFPDGVAAGPVAAAASGGLLLTASRSLPPATAAELRRLAPDRIVIVGSTAAISASVAAAAADIAPVERIGGADRYATAELLVRSVFGDGAPTVFIATGTTFPDALAAAPAAAAVDAPVLIVPGRQSQLTTSALALLNDLGATSVVVLGSSAAVSNGIEQQLRDDLGTDAVRRVAGSDRYTTAREISRDAFGPSAPRVIVASGVSFADTLSISVLAAREGLPIYLSLPYCTPGAVREALGSSAVTTRTLIGSVRALSPGVERLEPCRSIGAASSLWVLVNKKNPLPTGYVPSGLRQPSIPNSGGLMLRSDAASELERMVSAAQSAGAGRVGLASGYRSSSSQAAIYANSVRNRGQAYTDLYVARPGHSEHQTGLAADLYPIGAANCSTYRCLGATPQGRWLAANSWRYGFILRYEEGVTAVTGYGHESWHFRFVGTVLANDYRASGHRTLEQFFGQPAAPRY